MLDVDDVLAELDVLALDSTILETFANTPSAASALLADKRTLAVRTWLRTALERQGYAPIRHSVRNAPDQVWGYHASSFSDQTAALSAKNIDTLDLSTVIGSPGLDYLYVGFREPYRSLWTGMFDHVNAVEGAIASVSYWNGQWTAFNSFVDTTLANSCSFGKSGRFSWQQPADWQKRSLNSETSWRFYVRIGLSLAPSAATDLTQLLPVRTSRLTDPAARFALGTLYAESWGAQKGEWQEKADTYLAQASEILASVLPYVVDELELDDTEVVAPDSPSSAVPQQSSDLFTLGRG